MMRSFRSTARIASCLGLAATLGGFGTAKALASANVVVAASVTAADWTTQVNSFHAQVGQRFTLTCPANGTISQRLWGTDLYTDDSSICTAAVHAGLISSSAGGTVTVEVRPGASSYQGTTRNGVTSRDYGSWTGSFAFVRATSGTPAPQGPASVSSADWTTQVNSFHAQVGQRFTLTCPANGTISQRLWGTDLYTDDSSICTAAVHAGLISSSAGGTVTVEVRPGASSYQGTTRNGVTSRDYGSWTGSFVFVR